VRFAGDFEFRERLREWFSPHAIKDLSDELYKLRFREGSLTSSGAGAMLSKGADGNLVFSNPLARELYEANFKQWHVSGEKLYIPFPLAKRPFEAGSSEQSVESALL